LKIDNEIARNSKFPLNLRWKMLHFVPTFNGAYHHTPKKRHTCKLCHEHNTLTPHTSSHLAPTKLENRWSKYSHHQHLNKVAQIGWMVTFSIGQGFSLGQLFINMFQLGLNTLLLVLWWVEMAVGGLDAQLFAYVQLAPTGSFSFSNLEC